jgi:hypothetical protein
VIETRCIRGIRAAFSVEVPIGGEVCRMKRSASVLSPPYGVGSPFTYQQTVLIHWFPGIVRLQDISPVRPTKAYGLSA